MVLAVPGQQVLADATEGEVPVVEALEVGLACDKTLPWAFLIAADPETVSADASVAVLREGGARWVPLSGVYTRTVRALHTAVFVQELSLCFKGIKAKSSAPVMSTVYLSLSLSPLLLYLSVSLSLKFMCLSVLPALYVCHVHTEVQRGLQRSEEGMEVSRTGVTDGCKSPHRC